MLAEGGDGAGVDQSIPLTDETVNEANGRLWAKW
jgi:hypothetical protein